MKRYQKFQYHLKVSYDLPTALGDDPKAVVVMGGLSFYVDYSRKYNIAIT